MNKNNRHKKTPALAGDGVLGNESNYQERNVMSNISTTASNVIPFSFGRQQVRTLMIDDQPWFAAQDVLDALEYADTYKPSRAVSHVPSQWKGVQRLHTLGGTQQIMMISEQGLYFVLGRSDKPKALPFQMWLAGDVLPSIRKTGGYTDHQGSMGDLVGSVIGTSGEHVLDRVIEQKASPVPHSLQRSFKHTMKSRLRSRFNVPRTALIPAEYLNDACNFVAAYSLEGEWIGRASLNTHELTDKELYDVGFLIHHFLAVKGIYERWGVGSALRMLGSPIPAEITDHFSDAMMAIGGLKKRSADMDVAANRLGLRNGKATRSAAA